MNSVTIPVEGMSCGGCVSSVEKALRELPRVVDVKAQLQPGQVTLMFDAADIDIHAVVTRIEDAGYAVPTSFSRSN